MFGLSKEKSKYAWIFLEISGELINLSSVHTLITHTPPLPFIETHYVAKTRSVHLFIFGLARSVSSPLSTDDRRPDYTRINRIF